MYIFNPTEVEYWEKYFILQMLPTPEERVEVDISSGTREYFVIMYMKKEGHLFVDGDDDNVLGIASTKQGVKFYGYLRRIGHGSIESEEHGRIIVKGMEDAFYGINKDEEDEEDGDDLDDDDELDDNDLSGLYDPFLGTAARLIIILGYSIDKLESVLDFEEDRFDTMIKALVDLGFIDNNGNPFLNEEGLEYVLEKHNLG